MDLHRVLVKHLLRIKKEYKYLKKQEIQDVFKEMNQMNLVFSMILLIEILKIYLEEQLNLILFESPESTQSFCKYMFSKHQNINFIV